MFLLINKAMFLFVNHICIINVLLKEIKVLKLADIILIYYQRRI